MTPRWFIAVLAVAFAAVFPVACGSGDGDAGVAASSPVRVIAMTTQVGDLAREVGGDRSQVRQLEANADPTSTSRGPAT